MKNLILQQNLLDKGLTLYTIICTDDAERHNRCEASETIEFGVTVES